MGWSRSCGWGRSGSGSAAEPLRQTHQGTLYKRDRDRLTEDPVLACSIADALKPLARLPELWLELACHVGLIEPDPAGERLLAASVRVLDRQRGPLAADDRHRVDGAAILARAGTDLRRRERGGLGPAVSPLCACCSGCRPWANRSGRRWTTWPASSRSAGRHGTGCRSRKSRTRRSPRRARGGPPSGRARSRAGSRGPAARARRARDGLARRGLSARPGSRGRGRRERTARRAAHRPGTLCPGPGADASSPCRPSSSFSLCSPTSR